MKWKVFRLKMLTKLCTFWNVLLGTEFWSCVFSVPSEFTLESIWKQLLS